jgi:hypothetical protein
MKKVLFMMFGLFIFMVLLQGCSASKKAPVVGKNADISADFKSIKTYSWTSDIDNIPNDQIFIGPNNVYIFNNESGRKMIKDAMQYELDSRGYTMDRNNPDMLVSFFITEKPGSLRTTNGYVTVSSGEKVRTEDNVSYTDVKPGTLIINFIDAKANKQIWQGFASGILQPDQMNDQTKVREAVSSVFSQFKYNNKT